MTLTVRGTPIFLKYSASDRRWWVQRQRLIQRREVACLRILRGLAVPELARVPRPLLPGHVRDSTVLLATEAIGNGAPVKRLQLTIEQRVGTWLFVLEQLVAFRRHGVAYSDAKVENLVATGDPLTIHIVDFGAAIAWSRRGRRLPYIGHSFGNIPPELLLARDRALTERSLVFQATILLPQLLSKHDHSSFVGPKDLAMTNALLRRVDAGDLIPVLRAGLHRRVERRPRDYEHLYNAVLDRPLPHRIIEAFLHLRAPFARRLAGMGLENPYR